MPDSDKPSDGVKKDFFISYNTADRDWAEWIAWELEEAGFLIIIQDWHFRGNFVLEMDRAHREAFKTVAVLSSDYVTSIYTKPEWAARFAQDPTSKGDLIIPFRVRPVELEGLLAQVIYTDLIGLSEDEARDRVVARARGESLKPKKKPRFPGGIPADRRQITLRPPFPAALDRLAYAVAVRKRWGLVDLTALTRPGADDPAKPRPKLSQIFIPQNARRSRPAVSLPRDYLLSQRLNAEVEERRRDFLMRDWQSAERALVLDFLARPEARSSVVLGDPGAGKSSLSRWLTLQLLDPPVADAPSWRKGLGDCLPLLIELRDYIARETEGRCSTFLSYLDYLGREQGLGFEQAQLERYLESAPTLMIFDGLDEIFDPIPRKRIANEIAGFAARYPLARILVTSRIAAFDSDPFERHDFLVCTLDDLDNEQIKGFAEIWFDLDFTDQPDQAARARNDLLSTLDALPSLNALAGNPMLLTIMAIVARHERLTRSRVGLYEQALKVLCYGWDFRKELHLPAESPLRDMGPDDKLALLRQVAWWMQKAADRLRANALDEGDLFAAIEAYFNNNWPSLDTGNRRRAVRELIDLLQERDWMLTLRGPELYGFVHRTFLEYFVASELLTRFRARELSVDDLLHSYVLPNAKDDAWHEIIPLLAALLAKDGLALATKLIESLIPQPLALAQESISLALAFRCFAELDARQLGQSRATADRLMDALSDWMMIPDVDQGTASTASSSIAGALISHGRNWPGRKASFKRIGLKVPLSFCYRWGDARYEIALAMIGSMWGDNPVVWRRAVNARAIGHRMIILSSIAKHCTQDANIPAFLRNRAEKDSNPDVRAKAVFELARNPGKYPETIHFICDRAITDPEIEPRDTALRCLVDHMADRDPKCLKLVRERAVEDSSPIVRGTALWALTQVASSNPEILQLIKERAVNDPEVEPRRRAVWGLPQHVGHDPEVVYFVRQRALDDPDPLVRGVALASLGAFTSFRDDILKFVIDRAVDEPSPVSRAGALEGLLRVSAQNPEALRFVLARAVDEPDRAVRQDVALNWARFVLWYDWRNRLLRQRVSEWTGIDPRKPITVVQVRKAAKTLGKSENEIRRAYEKIATKFPLTLSWKPKESASGQRASDAT